MKIKVFLDFYEQIDELFIEIEMPFMPQIGSVIFECNYLLYQKAKEINFSQMDSALEDYGHEFETAFIVKEVWIFPIKGEYIILIGTNIDS